MPRVSHVVTISVRNQRGRRLLHPRRASGRHERYAAEGIAGRRQHWRRAHTDLRDISGRHGLSQFVRRHSCRCFPLRARGFADLIASTRVLTSNSQRIADSERPFNRRTLRESGPEPDTSEVSCVKPDTTRVRLRPDATKGPNMNSARRSFLRGLATVAGAATAATASAQHVHPPAPPAKPASPAPDRDPARRHCSGPDARHSAHALASRQRRQGVRHRCRARSLPSSSRAALSMPGASTAACPARRSR